MTWFYFGQRISSETDSWCVLQYLKLILFRKLINGITIHKYGINIEYPFEKWIFLYYTFSFSSRPFLDMLEASLSSLVSSCVLFCSWSFSLNNKTCRAFSTCWTIIANKQRKMSEQPSYSFWSLYNKSKCMCIIGSNHKILRNSFDCTYHF